MTVADDGIGVGAERIRAVTHGKELSRDGHLSSIGLSNVRDRLRLFTGDPHCFTLRAREGPAVARYCFENLHPEPGLRFG